MMRWEQRIRYAALTDIGFRRQNNQDSCAVALCSTEAEWAESGHLFIVADGMGGHAVGELASKIAVDTVPHTFKKLRERSPFDALRIAVESANQAINERGTKNLEFLRMGTTCSTLVLCPQGAFIGHVGDSRVYRIRNQQIDQLTFDHSLVWEMIHSRQVHPRDAERLCPRNVITRSLGPEPQVNVDMEGPHPVFPGDIFLLCSDGLSGLLSDSEIGMISSTLPPDEACRLLVNLANLRGGPDNITVIVIQTGDLPKGMDVVYDLPPSSPRIEGLSWGGLGLMCFFALLFLIGLYFFLIDPERRLKGGAILAIATLSAIAYWMWHRSQTVLRSPETKIDSNPGSTIVWRPYRTAPAIITDEFMDQLMRMEADLHRAALDDRWAVDWNAYDEHFKRARSSLEKRVFGRALAEYGRMFDALMTSIQQERKQQKKANRSKNKKASGPAIPVISEDHSNPEPKPPSSGI